MVDTIQTSSDIQPILTIKHMKLNRIKRIAKVMHHRTEPHVKVGVLIVLGIIAPAIASITLRVIELGSRVEMYF